MIALALTVAALYVVDAPAGSAEPVSRSVLVCCLSGLVILFALYGTLGRREIRRLRHELHRSLLEEVALRRAREVAIEQADRKSEFLAHMSHEIRTPLSGIIGMTELLLETELAREQRDFAETTRDCADSLLMLINDILDLSKIEAHRMELESIAFRVADCLDHGLKPLILRGRQKGLDVSCVIDPSVPEILVGDPGRLRQVVINLVGNAIKFTPQGQVVVRVDAESDGGQSTLLRCSVSDTGIGMSAETQQQLFRPFTQADAATTRTFGGTGLGLAISAHLVEMMGGTIGLESVPGQGSTFRFSVRLGTNRAQSAREIEISPAEVADRRILVVDGDATTRWAFSEQLASWGMRPLAVESAPEALANLRGAQLAGSPFDLVLMEARMADADGLALVESIKQDDALRQTPLIVVTSAGTRGDARRCRELGVAGYLLKPKIGRAHV